MRKQSGDPFRKFFIEHNGAIEIDYKCEIRHNLEY